jgi:hypothetical protein
MAGKKFSQFSSGANADANSRIVGYQNGSTTNNMWTPTELAAGLQEHLPESFIIACSDETTALTTGTKATFRMPYAFTVTAVRASLTTAGTTSGLTTIDINLGGSSIFTTNLLTIDFGDTTSVGATTAPNITTTALTNDGQMTIDVDGLSGGATEAGLKVTIIGYQS